MFYSTIFLVFTSVALIEKSACEQSSVISANPCSTKTDCQGFGFLDEHVICASGQCRCEPNFYYNKTSNNCLKYICRDNQDCQEYDHNRYCVTTHGDCECNPVYIEAGEDKMCHPALTGPCKTHFDCRETTNNNTVCLGNKCQCIGGYRFNSSKQLCEEITNCKITLDCETVNDPNRECKNGKCVCRKHFEESKENYVCYENFI